MACLKIRVVESPFHHLSDIAFTHAAMSDSLLSTVLAHLANSRPSLNFVMIYRLEFSGLDAHI